MIRDLWSRAALLVAESDQMAPEGPPEERWPARALARRVEKKGLRPRLAAAVIAAVWLSAIVVFGIVEHLLDRDSYETVWDGMWWATQTVTTVGYGDIVPSTGIGRLVASLLMIGGLSLFAVISATITSEFIARAQASTRSASEDSTLAKMAALEAQLNAIQADVARMALNTDTRHEGSGPSPPGDEAHQDQSGEHDREDDGI
jgi:voltage-gated potassium channel